MKNTFKFKFKEGNYKIISQNPEQIKDEIIKLRITLDKYIQKNKNFKTSLIKIDEDKNAPKIVKRMISASQKTGIGPMASVAGIIAELAAEKSSLKNQSTNIVENGGDIYIFSDKDIFIGFFPGNKYFSDKLAIHIKKEYCPISICSSSSKMGHSLSFGKCDIATVFSKDGALADSAATLACNLVQNESDLENVANKISNIDGIIGVILVKNDKIALAGKVPDLVKNTDPNLKLKITKDISNFEILE